MAPRAIPTFSPLFVKRAEQIRSALLHPSKQELSLLIHVRFKYFITCSPIMANGGLIVSIPQQFFRCRICLFFLLKMTQEEENFQGLKRRRRLS